jgi:hypothetical protein
VGLLDPAAPGRPTAVAADAGGGDLTGPPPPPPPVAGTWLMYGFEDPISVQLAVVPDGQGYMLTGRGCEAGWQGLFDPAQDPGTGCCGPLSGRGAGLVLDFAFDFPNCYGSGPARRGASVHASKDGTRLAGTITVALGGAAVPTAPVGPFGWLKLDDFGVKGPRDNPAFPDADFGPFPQTGNFSFQLALQGAASVGALAPGQTLYEKLDTWWLVRLTGELGEFWNPDFHWDEAARTYTAGPVPETIPGLPVKLELHVDSSDVVLDAVVTTADGATGTLLPVPRGP